jgi:hypothetical protein
MDMFVVPTIGFKLLYGIVIACLEQRFHNLEFGLKGVSSTAEPSLWKGVYEEFSPFRNRAVVVVTVHMSKGPATLF